VSDSNDASEFDGKCKHCKEKIEKQEEHECFVCGAYLCVVGYSHTMEGECIDCELFHYW